MDRRDTVDWPWVESPVPDDPEPAGTFGDQHGAVRKECQAPRVRQPLGNDDHLELLLRRFVDDRFRGERHRLCAQSPAGRIERAAGAGQRCRGGWRPLLRGRGGDHRGERSEQQRPPQ
jgi:hypothetical protein